MAFKPVHAHRQEEELFLRTSLSVADCISCIAWGSHELAAYWQYLHPLSGTKHHTEGRLTPTRSHVETSSAGPRRNDH
jgi:hypothetical protein